MKNEENCIELLRGLVMMANSLPDHLTGKNGDNIPACMIQTIADLSDELDVSNKVDLYAEGERTPWALIDRNNLADMQTIMHQLDLVMKMVRDAGRDYDDERFD